MNDDKTCIECLQTRETICYLSIKIRKITFKQNIS